VPESAQYEAIRRAVATLRIRAMQMSDTILAPYFKENLAAAASKTAKAGE
jgi:hypothetical protein